MAAQVLSGTGNVTYTNTTGQNVRIVINYVSILMGSGDGTLSFQGVTVDLQEGATYGKTLAYSDNWGANTGNSSMAVGGGMNPGDTAVPVEVAVANGETFSITHTDSTRIDGYNIIIIPEAG